MSGVLHDAPKVHTGKSGKPFTTAKVRADGATVPQLSADTGRKSGIIRHHLRKLCEGGRVRARNTKPAPHYAVIDTVDPPRKGEREWGDILIDTIDTIDTVDGIDGIDSHGEARQSGSAVNAVNQTAEPIDTPNSKANSGETGSAVNAVNAVNQTAEPIDTPNSKANSGETGSAVNAVNAVNQVNNSAKPDSRSGTAGTAGTQNSVEPLAVELAALAGLDVAAMLAGRLATDSEWAAFVAGLAKLNTRHPDKADEIAALVDRVNIAAESQEGAP